MIAETMTMSIFEALRSFRSRLFEIDADDEKDKEKLKDILDEYRDTAKYSQSQFDAFAEEYLITRFDVANLNEEIRPKVERLQVDGDLVSIRNVDSTYWDRDRLMFCLMFDNEEVFAKGIKLLAEKRPDQLSTLNPELSDSDESDGSDVETLETWRDLSLVKIAVLRGLNVALDVLGSLNDEINLSAIKLIYEFGHWKSLRNLLEMRGKMMWDSVRLGDFITFLMRAQTYDKDFRETEDGQVDYGKCVDILFKYADYETNEQNDDHYSALHLAVMYNKSKTIFHLLKKGAYIGMQDRNDRPAIWNIHAKTLEKYFDQCIINGDDLIVFNFENLIAPSEDYPNDMTAIEFISNSNDLKYLLEHPLIASFLFLKWNRLALIFYMDFMCYFILSIITGCLTMYYLTAPEIYLIEMCIMTVLFSLYVALRRTLQVIHCSSNYLRSWTNYLNSLLTFLIVVFLVLFVISVPCNFCSHSTLAAVCIILITYEFFMLAGSFWHFSIYSEMFIVVAINALKSLQLYAIFLPAFSLLFYILLHDSSARDSDGPNLNKFPTLGASIVKTIVMSVGEYDVINVNFDANTISIYIFIGFLFLISTVFMNLLNGLAVTDTQKIQSKARLTSFKKRTQVLARYEEILTQQNHWFRDKYPKMWKILRFFTHINTFVYRDKRIYIELDDINTVYAVKVMPSNIVCLRVPLRDWTRFRFARMSSKIVENALEIRERYELEKHRNRKEYGESVQESLINRITEIENTLKTMNATLRAITEKLIDK